MTALPLVSVPPISSTTANGANNNHNKSLLSLLESLQPDKRHVFLQPDESLPTSALNVAKETLEGFAAEVGEEQEARLKESRKRKREAGLGGRRDEIDVLKLRRVYVDGFETEQVWQQARRIVASVLKFSGGLLDELEEKGEVVAGDKADGLNDGEAVNGEEEEDEEDSEDEDELDAELDEDELEEDDLEGEDEEDIDALENGSDEELNGLGVDEDEEEDEDEDEQDGQEYVEDPDGLNDGFFNIDEFNRQSQYFEEQDARGDPNTDRASDDEEIDWDADPMTQSTAGSKRAGRNGKQDDEEPLQGEDDEDDEEEDGPTFGDMALDAPEGASDDEFDDEEAADDEGLDLNANGIYYKDFFAPPPRKSKGGKPKKKSVHFKPEQPAQEDVDRAMADVRRDLFDDESDNDNSEDALSDVSAGDPKSRRSAHERRQAKLAEEIRKLEAASVAKREWTLSGEAAAADRPLNSLLEEDLDFEHVGKPVPVITPEVTEGIEDMIKRRILAQQFDEVLRRRPNAEAVPSGTRRGMVELDDSKPSKGLAEVYEEEHVKNANPDAYVSQSDEKLQREEREIEALWKDVSARLDALSSWHYRPKPAAPSVSVVADVAAVAMEDAQPTTASAMVGEQSRMAPQEVYKAGADNAAPGEIVTSAGLPVARQEMSREDKVRRRRRAKERMRKAGADGAGAAAPGSGSGAGAAGAGKKTLSNKAKMQRDTIAELKKGGVKVINRKGEITDVEGKKTKVAAKIVSGGSFKL
ncbi:Mpp10 protein [Trichoderma citrinoviride]|uniref:U3 small nucleolar ribonucleoprotein protein MPP10 n=1 Tax=Trichoderma citrinoviride TaxID=58853 RepID=A0A2T4BKX2_9HYPO|nr:Mpp10 protein [Trichoderma citrinoviride]PTB69965.1 Mpp10 protein [Trichoderma citrinoviride]